MKINAAELECQLVLAAHLPVVINHWTHRTESSACEHFCYRDLFIYVFLVCFPTIVIAL